MCTAADLRDATPRYSPVLELDHYRFRIEVVLKGPSGDHAAVFFCPHAGPHDAALEWPMPYDVRIKAFVGPSAHAPNAVRGYLSGCYCDAALGCVLTCTSDTTRRHSQLTLHVYRLPTAAKTHFNELVSNIISEEWVAGACSYSFFTFEEPDLDVICIEKVGKARYICFTTSHPVAYDLKLDEFRCLKDSLSPLGAVHAAHAMDGQPFRDIHPGTARPAFAQELCVLDLVTLTARSLCRLPRPSSL
eukprot:gene55565-40897_t